MNLPDAILEIWERNYSLNTAIVWYVRNIRIHAGNSKLYNEEYLRERAQRGTVRALALQRPYERRKIRLLFRQGTKQLNRMSQKKHGCERSRMLLHMGVLDVIALIILSSDIAISPLHSSVYDTSQTHMYVAPL